MRQHDSLNSSTVKKTAAIDKSKSLHEVTFDRLAKVDQMVTFLVC